MNNLITIENVKGYLDPVTGTAYLNAEDVARGFGFTTVAKSGNAVIRRGSTATYPSLVFPKKSAGMITSRKIWCIGSDLERATERQRGSKRNLPTKLFRRSAKRECI